MISKSSMCARTYSKSWNNDPILAYSSDVWRGDWSNVRTRGLPCTNRLPTRLAQSRLRWTAGTTSHSTMSRCWWGTRGRSYRSSRTGICAYTCICVCGGLTCSSTRGCVTWWSTRACVQAARIALTCTGGWVSSCLIRTSESTWRATTGPLPEVSGLGQREYFRLQS